MFHRVRGRTVQFHLASQKNCAHVRRRSCPMDARPSGRHARRYFTRERIRVGTFVPNCGQCSEPIVQEFSPVRGREREQLRCTVHRVASKGSCVMRISKYGLRGCRVGEASNPGPRVKRRRRVESSSQQSESSLVCVCVCLVFPCISHLTSLELRVICAFVLRVW